jgi:hypothetical protein
MRGRAFAAAASLAAMSLTSAAANADFKVWTPDVDQGELALENVGNLGFDHDPDKNGEQSYTAELEYGVTSWWQTELELEFNRDPGPGRATYFNQITSENLFQFTQPGEYWLDSGFFAEYGQVLTKGDPNETTFGPVLRKDFWGTSNTVNFLIEKDLGDHAAARPQFGWAWETRFEHLQIKFGNQFVVEPGFQIYGQPGAFGRFANWQNEDNRGGPQLFGQIFSLGPGTLEWNGGILIGMSRVVPIVTPRWQFEYEIHY